MQREEPIRLFKSDFLEFFSHISPVTVAAIWAPVVMLFLYLSVQNLVPGSSWLIIPLAFFIGWFVWTFAEYTLHRYIFHYHPRSENFKKLFFVVHGIHHAQPMCRTRLVMPPALSVPLAFVFYGLFYLIMVTLLNAEMWFYPVFSGFIGGYLAYDMIHYQPIIRKLKRAGSLKFENTICGTMGNAISCVLGLLFPFGIGFLVPHRKRTAQRS